MLTMLTYYVNIVNLIKKRKNYEKNIDYWSYNNNFVI